MFARRVMHALCPLNKFKVGSMKFDEQKLLEEHLNDIRNLYNHFKPEMRIIFYDIEDGEMLAFPYKEYRKTLNKRSRTILKKQYEEAIKNNQIIVFASDSNKKSLKSFAIDEI